MDKNDCPYIVFKAAGRMFTLNSTNVLAIQEMPAIESVPQAPKGIRGIFVFHEDIAPVLDLRSALCEDSLESEAQGFAKMLEARKQDHLNWMDKLKESVNNNTKFTLATDPHKCAFGKWYDSYKPTNGAVRVHLSKIEEPHRALHETAIRVEECAAQGSDCCNVHEILEQAEQKYVKKVLEILEEAKDVLKDSFREMALVLSLEGKLCALSVDEVLSIDELTEASGGRESLGAIANTSLILSVRQSERYPNMLVLELDEKPLFVNKPDFSTCNMRCRYCFYERVA